MTASFSDFDSNLTRHENGVTNNRRTHPLHSVNDELKLKDVLSVEADNELKVRIQEVRK